MQISLENIVQRHVASQDITEIHQRMQKNRT